MKWSHLPIPGGLYAQDPDLLDKWEYIFGKLHEAEAQEADERERERKKQEAASKRQNASSRRGRRR